MAEDQQHAGLQLRFPESDIASLAQRYSYPGEAELLRTVIPEAGAQGFLTKEQFLRICGWKTQRSRSRCERNTSGSIEEATRLALGATDDRIKIGVLRVLDGVDWPTASVILHFCDTRPYPILDVRALWSLGLDQPNYTYGLREAYTAFVRRLARRLNEEMRDVDRGLWQYSAENQPPLSRRR